MTNKEILKEISERSQALIVTNGNPVMCYLKKDSDFFDLGQLLNLPSLGTMIVSETALVQEAVMCKARSVAVELSNTLTLLNIEIDVADDVVLKLEKNSRKLNMLHKLLLKVN